MKTPIRGEFLISTIRSMERSLEVLQGNDYYSEVEFCGGHYYRATAALAEMVISAREIAQRYGLAVETAIQQHAKTLEDECP